MAKQSFGGPSSGYQEVKRVDNGEVDYSVDDNLIYDIKKNSQAYGGSEAVSTFFNRIFEDDDDKGLQKVEETDTKKPSYYAFKSSLRGIGLGDNFVTDFIAGNASEMYRGLKIGGAQAESTVAGWDVMSNGRFSTAEEIEALIDAAEDMPEQTDAVRQYSSRYEQIKEEDGGVMAFIVGVAENPKYVRDVAISSLANMATSFVTSPDVAGRAIVGGVAGMVTSKLPGISKALGFLSGFMGSVSGSMDAAQTYSQLMQEQLKKDGKNFTPENIRALLDDETIVDFEDENGITALNMTGTRADILKRRSIRRGIAIGVVDGLSTLIAGRTAAGGVGKISTKAVRGVKATAEAMAGGIASEISGQTFGGQEYEAGEILTEGIAEKGIATTGVSVLPNVFKKAGVYKIGKQTFTESEFVKQINSMDDATLAAANVKVENDTALEGLVRTRQGDAYIDSQINAKVKDAKDRKELVKLQKELRKAESDAAKKDSYAVPDADLKVQAIQDKINAIINKYSSVDGRSSEVRARAKAGKEIKQARQKIYLDETEQFAEVSSEQLDFDPYEAFDTNKEYVSAYVSRVMSGMDLSEMTQKQISAEANRLAADANNSDGVNIVRDADGRGKIMINREVAAEVGAMNVGSHEVLHSVMDGALRQMEPAERKVVIKQFKDQIRTNLGQEVLDLINVRLVSAYTNKEGKLTIDLEETVEWFTALSDIIEDKENNITYKENKGFFDTVKDNIAGLFNRSTPYEKLSIKTGEQAFNFMKEYSKSVKGGRLSESMVEFAGRNKSASGSSFSKNRGRLIDDINDLQQGATTKAEFQKSNIFNNVFEAIQNGGAINNYIRSLQMSPEKTRETIDSVTDRLINFDPAAKRKDGTVIGPKGLGEFIMANVGFGKLDAAKKLAVKGEKTKRETSIDTQEAKELTNESTETKKQESKGQKARVLKSLADINIDNKEIISSTARAEINSLIEQNPKNLEAKISEIIDKEITKAVKAQMGKISNVKGEVVISEEYKAFIALNYENIVKSLDVTTIKNNYKTLFELTEIGKEDRKTKKSDKPSLKKDSNYRKGIFKIETNKAKFTKFFTEGGYTTLLARQKGLANQIAKGIVEDVVSNEIIENSNNNEVVIGAKLENYAKNLNKQKNEVQGNYNDIVNFSKKAARKAINDGMFLSDLIVKNKGVKGIYKTGVYPPRLINNPRKITVKMQEFIFNEIYADGNLTQLTSKELKGIQTAKILQKAGRIYANTNNGAIYEQFIIDVASQIPGIQVLSTTMAEGGIPDLHVMMHGKDFFVEVKMANAQYSSITISDYDISKNKWTIKKKYDFNPQIDALVQKASKGVKAAQKFVNDAKIPDPVTGKPFVWKKFGDPIPTQAIQMLKDEGLYKGMMAVDNNFDIDNIGEMYRGKEYPVYYIHIQGKGLFHMGVNPLKLPVPKLTGTASLTLRRVPSTKYKQVGGVKTKTGYTTLTYRAIPIIDAASVTKSDFSIGNSLEFNELMQTKEVKFLEAEQEAKTKNAFSRSINNSRVVRKPKGITVLDFDDTLATSKSLIKYTQPDGTKGTLTPEQYASTYQDLQDLGYVFDFSEFNKVVDGKVAPLFQKALKLQSKFGPENMFVLTARPAESAPAIFAFIKANGLNIPLKNITGLANSTAEAKALWMADKVAEGFNDFYFADDALQNVQAVKNMLDQFDVKSKVQQAKVNFSKSLDNDFNVLLEEVTGIESFKRFERTKARKRGADKGKFRLFIPPSHEDFVGLLYNFMGKGRKGDAHREFLEQALVRPLNRAYKEVDTAKQAVANDYKSLNKQMPEVNKMLSKKTPDGDFTYQDAIRVYLWDKHGYKIPGLSDIDQASLVELVKSDGMLQSYADTLNAISKQEKYVDPGPNWENGNIRIDLVDATGRVGRADYFTEFNENADIMFSEENLNKIEAAYGKPFREALEDMLHRIKTGINRPKGASAKPNMFMNWLNASVAGVMFFNTRSALLQQMSNVNYLNFADNNIFAAGLAFANQKQYWKDFAMIFNSDMLKQRRGGLQTDINGAELAEAIKKARPGNLFDQVAIITGKALRLGFLPTQIGDNIAIATGGAAFYRNRVNKYIKDGLSQKEAETKAFTDFQNVTQSTQQSARPDMSSQQQSSWIGKLVLNFLNTPSQYNRIIKKAGTDILNRRITPPNTSQMQSDMSNASRILYYGAAQNLIFYSLQTALFAVMFGTDDEDEDKRAEQFLKKKERVINGSIDTILRGSGIYGVAVSTLKNMAMKFMEQREKGYNKDESAVVMEMLNFSPVVGIKARRIVNAEKTLNYNKKVIEEMETFDIDNPMWSAVTNYTQTATTAPVNKIYQKTINLRNAADNDYTTLQRLLFLSGYTTWSLNLGDTKKMKKIKEDIKNKGKNPAYKKRAVPIKRLKRIN